MSEAPPILTQYIKQFVPNLVSESDLLSIVSSFQQLKLSKNELFVEARNVCNYFCFIESGILQHAIEIDGVEKTTYLALKNSVTTALNSFKNSIPSRKSIRALSDCNLWVINLEQFNVLLKENRVFYEFYFSLIENQIFLIDDYRIDLLLLSPEERYQKLLLNEPELLRKVPLHYLASFLGISSRHMSRIRKNSI